MSFLNKILSLFGIMPDGKVITGLLLTNIAQGMPDASPLKSIMSILGMSLSGVGVAHKVVKAQMADEKN